MSSQSAEGRPLMEPLDPRIVGPSVTLHMERFARGQFHNVTLDLRYNAMRSCWTVIRWREVAGGPFSGGPASTPALRPEVPGACGDGRAEGDDAELP